MSTNFEAKLWVNRAPLELNSFVQEFLVGVTLGAVSSLKGAGDLQALDLYLDRGEVKITLNDRPLSLTAFPSDLLANTLKGLVSTLKGVDAVQTLRVYIEAR